MATIVDISLKRRNISKCFSVDIEFRDLTYSVWDGDTNNGQKKLLKNLNGVFKSGQLTALMGASGAGKTTLLNVLSGYITTGYHGTIRVNDQPRDMKIFKKLASYIMQNDVVQPRLSVKESMIIAAHLKLGYAISDTDKILIVTRICTLLGLDDCLETRSEHLSGGQCKRLSVALELVNNPPVIFLDEPTTGLDISSVKKCMNVLRDVSREGRTVVCTIHQPSPGIFNSFDKVYVLGEGTCVYDGAPSELVPFLETARVPCPPTDTPIEYLIEIITRYPETITTLSSRCENQRQQTVVDKDEDTEWSCNMDFPLTTWQQNVLLLKRMYTQYFRNRFFLLLQLLHHLFMGFLFILMYFGTGNKAIQVIPLYKYCLSSSLVFLFTYILSNVITIPLQMELLKREYFNRWYNLKAFYMAVLIAEIPPLIIFGSIFIIMIYFPTGQPYETDRFLLFGIMQLAIGFSAQGVGLIIGSLCKIKVGSVFGPLCMAIFLITTAHIEVAEADFALWRQIVMILSFYRFGVIGICITLFQQRKPLDCAEEIYCYFTDSEKLLKELGIADRSYQWHLFAVLSYGILFKVLGYVTIKCRLSHEVYMKIYYLKIVVTNLAKRLEKLL